MAEETIFSNIITREIPSDIVYQDDVITAFRDVNPQAPTHILIVPNHVIPTVSDVTAGDEMVLGKIFTVAAELAEQVADEILTYCIDAGGSITGEHGVGVDKACHMPKMFSADDLDTMQFVRRAFDPTNLCNPGKVFPTPRLCGEVPGPYRRHPVEEAGLAERM